MPKKKLCSPTKHVWRKFRTRERCEVCLTLFPCPQKGCGHVDCHVERNEPPPPSAVWNFLPGDPLRREP